MSDKLIPAGYRRYEPTTNNARFIKYESQIPVEEYEAQRERSVDVVENVLRNIAEGSYLDINPDCGDSSLRSLGGQAISYARRNAAQASGESDYLWQQYNRSHGVGASPIVQQATSNQFGRTAAPQQRGYQQQHQPPQPQPYGGDPMEDFLQRIKQMAQSEQAIGAPAPAANNPFSSRPNRAGLPGMIRNASIQPNARPAALPGMRPQTASVPPTGPMPANQNDEAVAEDIRRRRAELANKVKIAGKQPGPQPSKIIQQKPTIHKPNLNFEEI